MNENEMNENEETSRMECLQFEDVVHDLDRPEAPESMLREAALAHAESCSHCAQLMTDCESLDFSLQMLAARDARLQAPAHVEADLRKEFRLQRAQAERQKSRGLWAALGAVATVFLALGIALHHGAASGSKKAAGTQAKQAPAESGASVEVADNRAPDEADATAFVPLPYAADPGTLEGGAVVRVELSRSALASMGMPVADASSNERIPADIMLSEDGAPQAIRLVSPASLESDSGRHLNELAQGLRSRGRRR